MPTIVPDPYDTTDVTAARATAVRGVAVLDALQRRLHTAHTRQIHVSRPPQSINIHLSPLSPLYSQYEARLQYCLYISTTHVPVTR